MCLSYFSRTFDHMPGCAVFVAPRAACQRPCPKKERGGCFAGNLASPRIKSCFISCSDGCVNHSSKRGAVGVANKEQKELREDYLTLKMAG